MGAIIAPWPAPAAGNYLATRYLAAFPLVLTLQVLAFVWMQVASKGGSRAVPKASPR